LRSRWRWSSSLSHFFIISCKGAIKIFFTFQREVGSLSFRARNKRMGFSENALEAGLPDGLFSNQKSQFG
jgi:hypothetical protein